jgi:hypothetical protein
MVNYYFLRLKCLFIPAVIICTLIERLGTLMEFNKFPYHTIFIGAYPTIYLFAANIVFIRSGDIVRSLGFSLLFSLFFLLVYRVITRSWEKAGLLTTLLVFLFFSFGHIFNTLEELFSEALTPIINVSTLAWIWSGLYLVIAFFIIRLTSTTKVTLFLNISSMVLLCIPLVTILTTYLSVNPVALEWEREKLEIIRGQDLAETSMVDLSDFEKPHIFMIYLDGYERADILAEKYNFDNSTFIQKLQQRGFFVAEKSHSNFLNTTYSMNTSMNLVYFSDFPGNLIKNARYNLQTNYVSEFLQRQGYKIVVFDSGTGDSNNQYADVFLSPLENSTAQKPSLNSFEVLLIRTTLGLTLLKGDTSNDQSANQGVALASSVNQQLNIGRQRLRFSLEHLPDYASEPTPYFMFAHIYSPHIPFLFGPLGEDLLYEEGLNLYWYEPAPEDYIEKYIDQIKTLNGLILQTIDTISAKTNKPYIIILQSDHGDDKFLSWSQPDAEGVEVRSSILNAIYFSDGDYEDFYPTMTSVNTFRLVLNHWFGTSYPLMPDRVYFHEHPLDTPSSRIPGFSDACEVFALCLPDQ